jgi:hypothetical protein
LSSGRRASLGGTAAGPNRAKHAEAAEHPILRSIELGEDWMWCVVDKEIVRPAT